ncbi:hypothetical protein VN12_08495 [Pirellula sp. SH-Sr6A]|uniref:DUF1559 family PulG-like putative transporter n=1 Tax=Pirellula sp. SH-Sr6A TaxID=1632865 RepID=UPI00078B557F|nr:DUF1559 domain-containing protein [Pirellula sp. SH-Sr6A]AMV32148.1 hypothetical protein VN12_08495 [Pirellula sp. SH-Sr6A]
MRTNRRAFSLLELIISISLVGLLLSLFVPAVQAVRESARAIHCMNNMRQIATAMSNFESTKRRYPSGGWGYGWVGFPDMDSDQPGSWGYAILPYLEQNSLFEIGRYHSAASVRDTGLRARISSNVPIFNCPSRRSGVFAVNNACIPCLRPVGVVTALKMVARSDYAVNIGSGTVDRETINFWPLDFYGPSDDREGVLFSIQNRWPAPPPDWSGISYLRRSIKSAEIIDGLSNTILTGEKYLNSLHYKDGLDWGDSESLFSGFNNDNHRSTNSRWPLLNDTPGLSSIGSFGSPHTSCTFALCDCSVRSISFEIDTTVYHSLGSRSDNK